jgi:hypothetical protein
MALLLCQRVSHGMILFAPLHAIGYPGVAEAGDARECSRLALLATREHAFFRLLIEYPRAYPRSLTLFQAHLFPFDIHLLFVVVYYYPFYYACYHLRLPLLACPSLASFSLH